ncbi:MAG: hypothetical protein IJ242_13905 [Clostridia bacterium]|nr:hypothetical protein [Clostridia bacterium]
MRKQIVLVLVVLCLLSMTAAAEYSSMPGAVSQIIYDRYYGCCVTGYVNPAYGNTAFVAIQNDGTNDLVCLQNRNGRWSYAWHRREVMPQDGMEIVLVDRSYSNYGGLNLGTAFSIREAVNGCYETIWEQQSGEWHIRAMLYVDTDGSIVETFRIYSDGVRYTGWDANGGSQFVAGSVQDNIRYFIYSIFPKNLSTLRKKLSTPPAIPDGTLTAQNIRFSGGQQYPVYSGPGEYYLRGGNGKAMVSTNDWIQVFGREEDWILIQYNISNNKMRIGWIDDVALPSNAYVPDLDFTPIICHTAYTVNVTDDPLNSQAVLTTIPAGAEVDWLAALGEWAYIEYTDAEICRGFVPSNALTTDQPLPASSSDHGAVPVRKTVVSHR